MNVREGKPPPWMLWQLAQYSPSVCGRSVAFKARGANGRKKASRRVKVRTCLVAIRAESDTADDERFFMRLEAGWFGSEK
jgi:hypothetical protein